jgi:branched-chain amino acid transport system ATP-binding protein
MSTKEISVSSTPRLEAKGVTMKFGGLVALSDVDLKVPAGQIIGLVGPNGAGKSTLFGVLSGLLKPTSGAVFMEGVEVTGAAPQVRARRGLARTFQHPELFASLTVREHIALGYRVRHNKSRIVRDLLTGRGLVVKKDAAEDARVDELLEELNLTRIQHSAVVGLPLGTSRLVEIGRALATDPQVMLMDEPSSGLDVAESEDLANTMRKVVAEHGVSLLFVEHDVPMVLGLCDYVYVIDFGVKIAEGTPDEIRTNAAVRAAYLGEDSDDIHISPEDADLAATSAGELA